MKLRSAAAVFLLPIVTLGVYTIVWFVATKNEMNASKKTKIPTAWLAVVPVVGWWWQWRFCVGINEVTNGRVSQVSSFLLTFLLGSLGMAIVQSGLNSARSVTTAVPVADRLLV